MNADDLYNRMKNALDFFGLRFHEKEQMQVSIDDQRIVFSYDGNSISFRVEN